MLISSLILTLIFPTSLIFAMSLNELNSPSKSELIKIKGIGDKKADRLIKERNKAPFKSFQELQKRVKGIGKSVTKTIQDFNSTKSSKRK